MSSSLFTYLLRQGDNSLVLGHRLSELCSKGPILEEDIAISNIALDHLGHAQMLLKYAAQVENEGRTEDDIAYKRAERQFLNTLIMEQPNGDFGQVIARNFLIDAFQLPFYEAMLHSKDETLQGIAAKAVKEARYHLRHSSQWMLRLGDGTQESHERVEAGLDFIWPFVHELFEKDPIEEEMITAGIAPDPDKIRPIWDKTVNDLLSEATLDRPEDGYKQKGGRDGIHSEHLGFMLAEMQYLPRAYPDATW